MADLESRCLDAFPQWLRSLGDDAGVLAASLESASLPEPAKRRLAGALNYLFKSLDLIPDGIEDLGFLDDAFVIRVAVATAPELGDEETLASLKADAALIEEFLGDLYPRLCDFVAGLDTSTARGRSVDDILADPAVRAELTRDIESWAQGFNAPTFARDEKNLVKLRSFLGAKLP